METISECIRKYVEAHDNEVTSCEVINYILEEKKFETTEQWIRNKLTSVLKEDYILKEKRINIIGRKIRNTLCMIVRKSGGEYSICSKKNNCNK